MVSRSLQTLGQRRSARARLLATRHEASSEALIFLSEIFDWQTGSLDIGVLLSTIEKTGPEPLRMAAAELTETTLAAAKDRYLSGEDRLSPQAFIARVLLQSELHPRTVPEAAETVSICPRCGELPQGGCLRPLAHGNTLSLFCSLCSAEWGFERGRCPACGETEASKLRYHTVEQFPQIQTLTCESCRRYLHLVDLSSDTGAVPEVDEIAAMPIDVWASEQGLTKISPNLAGI